MDIFLTFDYELFFGEVSGSVDKCMLEPAEELIRLTEKHNIKLTFFWDVGHYVALKEKSEHHSTLLNDKEKIENQIRKLTELGHDVQLHIHPHWEKAEFVEGAWKMNLEKHYKFSDFNKEERISIFRKYYQTLTEVIGKNTSAFRAGGWCIQPFAHFKSLFQEHNIRFDSSTMPGVKWISDQYQLDFTRLQSSEPFRFSSDECEEDDNGEFMEYPIASTYYSPWFFWKLYVLGRLFPEKHKMWGDGNFVAQPGGKKESLTKGKIHHASSDGYFASQLQHILNLKKNLGNSTLVVIGHPKSLTRYSLGKLDEFIAQNKADNCFKTFQDLP